MWLFKNIHFHKSSIFTLLLHIKSLNWKVAKYSSYLQKIESAEEGETASRILISVPVKLRQIRTAGLDAGYNIG